MEDKIDDHLDFITDLGEPFAHEVARAIGLDINSPTLKEDIRRKLIEDEKLGIRECTLEIDDKDEEILTRFWTEGAK